VGGHLWHQHLVSGENGGFYYYTPFRKGNDMEMDSELKELVRAISGWPRRIVLEHLPGVLRGINSGDYMKSVLISDLMTYRILGETGGTVPSEYLDLLVEITVRYPGFREAMRRYWEWSRSVGNK
jgi:hypothetical protein